MEKILKINVPEGYVIDNEKSTFENIVFKSIENNNTEILKEMSDFLFSMINGTTIKITGEKEITHYNNNEWIIQQDYKNGYLYINYYKIWKVFEEKYKLKYNEIRDFIRCWVETNTNWNGLTPEHH